MLEKMKLKNEKGITLIVLTITIIVILIVTSITIYNSNNQLAIKKVNNLYSDLESISTKVTAYYLENDTLPVYDNEYESSKSDFKTLIDTNGAEDNVINPNDGETYHVIDLSKLDNLTLNYGLEYKDWKEDQTPSPTEYQDLYIINDMTHQIYYPKGIKLRQNVYFTRDIDIALISRIDKSDIDDDFTIDELTSSIQKNKASTQAEEKIIATANLTLSIDTNSYVLNTLSYAWSDTSVDTEDAEQIKNITFSKFTLNQENNATLVSKGLDRLKEKYYLYIKVLDINGEEHFIENEVERLPNVEEGWALADDTNTLNDWYAYTDTSGTGAIATVNAPKLADGMEAIKYVGETDTTEATLTTLISGSRWANAMTKDGSMWVWIPRFAYKITSGYHKSGDDINPEDGTLGAGTIEIAFVKYDEDTDTNVFLDSSITGTIKTSGITDSDYDESNPSWILAPGFEFGDEHLDGFWFAKFEASNTDRYGADSSTANDTALTLQIKPNVTSWRNITSANIFETCLKLTSESNYSTYFNSVANVDTHMTKNVEWGAVAYLAHSKYGLNGQEICINTNSSYKTGMGSGSTTSAGNTTNQYNKKTGITASTTKNVYGIYDMSGGAWEYVAGCYTQETSIFTSKTESTFISKYIDVYSDYCIAKYGDTVYETSSSSSGTNAWFKDYSNFVGSSFPAFKRGGYIGNGSGTGLFCFSLDTGNAIINCGFRSVCVVM